MSSQCPTLYPTLKIAGLIVKFQCYDFSATLRHTFLWTFLLYGCILIEVYAVIYAE